MTLWPVWQCDTQNRCLSASDVYLMEFLEDEGVLTLLDILSQSQTNEDDKAEALRLPLTFSNAGCNYKEFICEKHGLKVVAECMTMSNTNHTQETVTAKALMESISYGYPKYQDQVYKSLTDLMSCTPTKAQQSVLGFFPLLFPDIEEPVERVLGNNLFAAFKLPRKSELGAGFDVRPEVTAF
ncbi:LOW QUALITY PROTEIN: armadillo-like helical domain containing protein 1 [Anableps anableps]